MSNKAQINLVPNYSFEDTIGNQCFSQMGVSQLGASNPILKNWYSSSNFGSPDYMNTCANPFAPITFNWTSSVPLSRYGYQMPRTGNAYVGMGTYIVYDPNDSNSIFVEYTSVKLNQALKPNTCYYAEFYASMADYCEISVNQLSMLLTMNTFTTASYSFTNTIQPQIQWDTTKYFTDTLNWVKISSKFLAQGGEQYLTIGNFKDGSHTKKIGITSNFITPETTPNSRKFSFVFIDDVSLYELPTPKLQSSYTLCPTSDSLLLGDTARIQTRYQWYVNGILKDTSSYIKIKPNQTTTYILKTTQCATTTQTVVVTYSNNCEPIIIVEPTIPNVFTPNGDGANDVWSFELKNMTEISYSMYNRWGNLIKGSTLMTQNYINWDGRTTSGEVCNEGVYFYTLQYTDANGDVHKKNGYVSLIR